MKRTLIIAAGVLAVLAIVAGLVLPRFLDPERYRPKVEQMLAGLTGRSVVVGPMRLHVFPIPGITADGFTLGEDASFGTAPFLKADRIDARVRLMPLFSSKLDVLSFDIEKPAVHLHRDAKGRWNLASLMERAAAKDKTAAGAAPAGGGLDVLIERFRLIDGSVDLSDELVVQGATQHVALTGIELTLSDLSTTSPIGISLKLALPGSGSGSIEGRLGPQQPAPDGGWPIDARLKITGFNGGPAAPYLARATGLHVAAGSLDLDAALKGTPPHDLAVDGRFDLKALQLSPAGGGHKPAPLDGSLAIAATLSPTETKIVRADLRLGNAAVTLSGALTDLAGKPKADVRAVASKVAFKDVAPLLTLFGPSLPPGLATKGDITLDLAARGPIDDPLAMEIHGTATVSGFEFSDPSLKEPIRELGATLTLSGDRAELRGLTAALGRSRIQGTCAISRFAHPVLDVELVVPLLDVDEILSFLPAGSQTSSSPGQAAPSGLRDVTVRGTLAVNDAKAMNLKLTGAHARLDLSGGEARLHEITAKLYGGTLSGDVTAGVADAGPPFAMNAKVQGVDFNGLCTDFSKDLAGVIHGTLDTSLDVKGRGLDTPALRNQLQGGAVLALRNGKLTSFGFLKQLGQVLEAAGGRGIGKDETPFDSLTGTFDIRGGRAATQDLKLVSPDLGINGKGSIGLDQSIAMNVGVVLSGAVSADMVAKTDRLKVLMNPKGQLALDMTIGGTIQKPSIGLDPNMLKRAAEEALKKKGADAIRHLFDRKKP